MTHRIVIVDADTAHAQEIKRNIDANIRAHVRPGMDAHAISRVTAAVAKAVTARYSVPRPHGTVHDYVELECPDGLPNCRNCGDAAHAASCLAQGHCPHCGTLHGVAPDSVIAANGYALEKVI